MLDHRNMTENTNIILVVEDQIPNMQYILYLLKKPNIRVIKAYSGEEALDLLDKARVDLFLIDINLGDGMSGIDLLRRIRSIKQYNQIPVVAVTAYCASSKHVVTI